MYENLINQTIDKKNAAFKDFPDSLDGEIYVKGDKSTGWETRVEQTLLEAKKQRINELKEEFIEKSLATEITEVNAAETKEAVRNTKIRST